MNKMKNRRILSIILIVELIGSSSGCIDIFEDPIYITGKIVPVYEWVPCIEGIIDISGEPSREIYGSNFVGIEKAFYEANDVWIDYGMCKFCVYEVGTITKGESKGTNTLKKVEVYVREVYGAMILSEICETREIEKDDQGKYIEEDAIYIGEAEQWIVLDSMYVMGFKQIDNDTWQIYYPEFANNYGFILSNEPVKIDTEQGYVTAYVRTSKQCKRYCCCDEIVVSIFDCCIENKYIFDVWDFSSYLERHILVVGDKAFKISVKPSKKEVKIEY